MKHLTQTFKLLFFVIQLKSLKKVSKRRLFILLFSFICIPSVLQAASATCPGVNLNVAEGSNTITELNANSTYNYHQITIPADGSVTIVFTNTELQASKISTFYVAKSCSSLINNINDPDDIYVGATAAKVHSVARFSVTQGETIQMLVANTGNNEDYKIEINYAITSNTPSISIDPTAKSIIQGTSSVTLDVKLSEAANKDAINVTYEHNCTGNSITTGIITFAKGEDEKNLLINTSSLTEGMSCIVTLTDAVGSGDQEVGSISPATSTITVTARPEVVVDLTITKTDSADPVAINSDFSYTITVANNGEDPATNIIVTDTLPSELTYLNTAGSDAVWNCNEIDGNITCTHSGSIAPDASNSITVNVTAPSTEGTITNEANVTSDNEIDFSNNSTVEDTTIGDTSNPADLCYTNVLGTGSKCQVAGYFYYAPNAPHTCLAQQDIRNQNPTDTLNNVIVYKLYNPNIDNGICNSPDQGTCERPTTHSISEYSTYMGAYRYDLEDINPDTNLTIEDTNTWYSNSVVSDIILYTTYEKNGLTYSGKMSRCSAGGNVLDINDFLAQVDIVDTIVSPTAPYEGAIATKVSNKPNYTMTAVYLGDTGMTQNSNTIFTSPIDMTVLYYLSDDSCTETVRLTTLPGGNEPVASIFESGDSTRASNSFTMAYTDELLSKKITRFKYKAVDIGKIIFDMDIDCPNASTSGSASGTVTGIPACLTSNTANSTPAERYRQVFGDEAFVRCWEAIANGEPCNSSTNAANVPEPYNTQYGCLECSIGDALYTCSTDAFAIRPDHFDITATDPDFPNLLRAGEDYNHTVYAYDYGITSGTVGSLDYNQTGGSGGYLDLNQSRFMATGAADDGTLQGDLVWSAWDFNMTNGISNQNGDLTQTEVAGVQYDDVGKINLRVEDKEWASVDINNPNDPTPHDCSPDGAYLCGDKNVSYIPHHFGFAELNITNQAGPNSTFTYIADDRGMPSTTSPIRSPMAARVQTRIEALNKNNGITENFRTGNLYYENPISVTQVVAVPAFGNPNGYLYPDANESNITNSLIGFGRPGMDDNGTRNIAWDESTYPLEFNFRREINQPANPFDVNGSYLSISMLSRYVDPDDGDIADINGSRIGDQNGSATCATDPGCVELNADNNATFYYARSRSSQFFYEDISNPSVNTPILIDVYCDLGFTACDNLGIDTVNGQINEMNWWLSWNHNALNGDGNITLRTGSTEVIEGAGAPTVTPTNVQIVAGAKNENVIVTSNATTLPMTAEIELVRESDTPTPSIYTNEWLIYNPYDAILTPSPFYKVRFVGTSGWAGHGDTGHVVDSNISTKKNRRLGW